jgi:RNA recognition motif-containing protein
MFFARARPAGIGFVNYVSADAARLAQESMNGISMGDRLLHVLVQNPAARSRSGAQGMSPTHSFSAGSTGSFQQSSRQQPVSAAAMHAAAANLGFNASALATLQAGFIPQTSATGSTSLHSPNGLPLSVSHGGYGSNMGSQHLGSFSQLQW